MFCFGILDVLNKVLEDDDKQGMVPLVCLCANIIKLETLVVPAMCVKKELS